jgi:hypothetical protein
MIMIQIHAGQKPKRLLSTREGPALQMITQYKCLVPIYTFPEMKLRGLDISKTELY